MNVAFNPTFLVIYCYYY